MSFHESLLMKGAKAYTYWGCQVLPSSQRGWEGDHQEYSGDLSVCDVPDIMTSHKFFLTDSVVKLTSKSQFCPPVLVCNVTGIMTSPLHDVIMLGSSHKVSLLGAGLPLPASWLVLGGACETGGSSASTWVLITVIHT